VLARALRVVVAILAVGAVVWTYADAASRGPTNPFNVLGYFTIQSNLILAGAYLLTSLVPEGGWWTPERRALLRACATTYIAVVGLVYHTLLGPLNAQGGIAVPIANFTLHTLTPVYGVLDWVLSTERTRLPYNKIWLCLCFPAVWLGVVLVRGATDGWVPYPFLDPDLGYAVIAGYAVGILVVLVLFGWLTFWVTHRRSGVAAAAAIRNR
jgi:hypothetical protein